MKQARTKEIIHSMNLNQTCMVYRDANFFEETGGVIPIQDI
jgi:hypothetical protein